MSDVGIVGRSGEFGALSRLLGHTGSKGKLWELGKGGGGGKLPGGVKRVSLEEMGEVPLIFFCAPIEQARATAIKLGEVLTGRHVVVHTLRGVEVGGAVVSQILEEETPTRRIGFLTGPMVAEDIEGHRGASGLIASRFPEAHELLCPVLVYPGFRVYRSQDLEGSQWMAIAMRVLAFVCGVALELDRGGSVQATLQARGLAEAGRLIVAMGGTWRTVSGLSGVGNLLADTHGGGSQEVVMGREFVQGKGEGGKQVAGLKQTIEALMGKFEAYGIKDAHIYAAARAMLAGKLKARDAAGFLMKLPVLDE